MPSSSPDVFPGADETTPSYSQYFSWINNTNEGATEAQTLVNLDFFRWLHDEFGMVLDIYAFDAGTLDGPSDDYGSLDRAKFRDAFPHSFDRVFHAAQAMGTRLGMWLGPDGFGETDADAEDRIRMLVHLCQEYDFVLYKLDGVCGQLRPEKQDAFVRAMTACRTVRPDLIVLNHRLPLGKGLPHATTFLWEGGETYVDVHMINPVTAPHNRAGVLARGLPPHLTRLTEDHGVCLSSCLDYWEDDLILQAFNRNLILAPEIYANPWLLRDDEYPKLARIYTLHRRYRDLLIPGIVLSEDRYGPHAVSRGDETTRFLTFRNLSWEPRTVSVRLDASIGLGEGESVEARRFHPSERILSVFPYGAALEVEVAPFRSCLLGVTTGRFDEAGVTGADYEVIHDLPDRPVTLRLLGAPGGVDRIALATDGRAFALATLDGQPVPLPTADAPLVVEYAGPALTQPWRRKLADLAPCPVPDDAEALYEATCFSGDNNALEVRELLRSGPTRIPAVQAARDAFLNQPVFKGRGLWDRWMFDGDDDTFFRRHPHVETEGLLRVDFGEPLTLDRIVIRAGKGFEATPGAARGEVSADLKTWRRVDLPSNGLEFVGDAPEGAPIRYFRMRGFPEQVAEVEGFRDGRRVDRSKWRGSTMFREYRLHPAVAAWSATFTLPEAPSGSYLAVAINGRHGREGAVAALRVNAQPVGAPRRAVSYPCVVWEHYVRPAEGNTTYYFPVEASWVHQPMEAVALALHTDDMADDEKAALTAEVWITAYPPPAVERDLTLE